MKKARVFMMLFSVALIMVTIILGVSSAQEPDNYFKLKGEVLNGDKVDITLYERDFNGVWFLSKELKSKSKYRLRISTNVNYQVIFSYPGKKTKVLNIIAGVPGVYLEYVDIDFGKDQENRAYMYQEIGTDRYIFEVESVYYSIATVE